MTDKYPPTPAEQALSEAELVSYDQSELYEDATVPIQSQLEAGRPAEEITGYLGSGTDKHAFRVKHEGMSIIVKSIYLNQVDGSRISRLGLNPADVISEKTRISATPLIRGEGVPRLEQLLSANPATGVIVTTPAEGKRLESMWAESLFGITPRHLEGLQLTLDTMKARGLHPHNAGGIFFSRRAGFNFVDYELNTLQVNDHAVTNQGSIETLEEFIHYALTDFKKIEALQQLKEGGMYVTPDMYETTGMRAMIRAKIMRRAQKLQNM